MRTFLNILTRPRLPAPYSAGVLALVFIFCAGFIGINYISNDFGLWRYRESTRIWTLEKTSKYLMAHRYVPENFDTVMIGASVSANMDTRKIKKYRVYNLSMSGGNITETGAAARAYLEARGDKKLMIVTLHPYITKNSGVKSFQINEREYYGSLFSLIPVRLWLAKIQVALGINQHAFDESAEGWNNFNYPWTQKNPAINAEKAKNILEQLKAGKGKHTSYYQINPQAVKELKDLLILAREKGVKIAAYYYPIFGPTFEVMDYTGEWKRYRSTIDPLFKQGEIIFDMNTTDFDYLRYNNKVYHDGSHLTQTGANAVLDALNQKLDIKNP